MDADAEAAIAELRGEITALRTEMYAGAKELAGGDGVDVGLPLTPLGGGETQGAFRWEGGKITQCHFYAAHGIHALADVQVGEGEANGTWYLNVSHPAGGSITGSVSKTEGQNNDDNTCIKLFEIENGEVKKDYRGMPFIPIYA